MKKTLIALAAGLACASAGAANVDLYGVVDTGFSYYKTSNKGVNLGVDGHAFSMSSGQYNGSRWGLKGSEDLGDGWKVGFVFENGFNSDSGTLGQGSRLFGREAQVYVEGPYGKISAGRVGLLSSDVGSFGISENFSAFGTGIGDSMVIGAQTALWATKDSRMDNTLTYASPEFSGFKGYLQYSLGANTHTDDLGKKHEEGKHTAERYLAVGGVYSAGNLNLTAVVDWKDKASNRAHKSSDQWTVTVGANYTCAFATSYLSAQYFKHADSVGGSDDWGDRDLVSAPDTYGNVDGFGVVASVNVPALGGDFMASLGFMKAENKKSDLEVTRFQAAAGYAYPISKRTKVYGAVNWVKDKLDVDADTTKKPSAVTVGCGLVHKF